MFINTKKRLRILLVYALFLLANPVLAQLNTDRITAIGRNALYFDDYVLSIQYFNQVIKVKPYLAEPYLYRAIAKIQLGDYTGAERDCSEAISHNPFLPGAYYTRGFVYRQLKQYDKAENDFTEALLFAPENKTYMLLRADVLSLQEKYDSALIDINYLIKREPNSAQLYFEKGTITIAQKDTNEAFNCFSKSCELDSQNPSNWSALGMVNLMLDNDNDALLALTKAINLGSKWAGDYVNRGIIFYKKHNYRGALSDYDKALEYAPNEADIYYNRGLLRAELGDLNNALTDLNKAHELSPEKTELLYQRGLVNLQLRQWQDATEDFNLLIEQYPYFLPSYYLAAQAYNALGNEKDAYRLQHEASEMEKNKEKIQQGKQVNTNVQIAQSQPQKRDRRKEFSNSAAQNITQSTEENQYESEARGTIQKRYADVVNEPNFVLSYYSQAQALRMTNYAYYLLQDFNKSKRLPSPLHFVTQELPLTAEMVNSHFASIDALSVRIDKLEEYQPSEALARLYLGRAVELAHVQDYSSAIEDATKALQITEKDAAIVTYLRATWRYKLLEYQHATGELSTNSTFDFELILRDYDQVIKLQPDFAFAYYNKANILCTQKAFKDAIYYYSQAIEKDHDFAEAWFNRGLTRIFTDDIENGIADLSKAGELGIYQAYNLITRFQ